MLWTVVLEKILESPLDCKETQPVHPKGDQSWVFIGRTDFEAETPIVWPPDAKSWLIWKDPDAGKDWGQVEKGLTEDEMVGWHHQVNGHGFGWTLGFGDGQGGLACCSLWGCKQSDTPEQLNWTELIPLKWNLSSQILWSNLCWYSIEPPVILYEWSCVLSHFSRPTLCYPMDCSPLGSSLHGIVQVRLLKWVAMPFCSGSSWPRAWTHVSCVSYIGRKVLYY